MTGISRDIVVGAIDVGSPKNIGWAVIDSDGEHTGQDLDAFIETFATAAAGKPAALGFEAPMFIPCRSELSRITAQRNGDNGKPWSAGAGATVTTIGLAVMVYTLRILKERMGNRPATLNWHEWPNGDDLLLFEAFVSGHNHAGPGEHWIDALNAARGFLDASPNLNAANAVSETDVLSLIGTCLVRTGWRAPSIDLLQEPCLVIRPDGQIG